jgi:DNA-binding CsgD family transcriptional regulator
MASLLAAMEHITPEYARAHIERARREHIGAGLLIHRMRSADPAPLTRAEEERQRYIGGEYADLILH